MNAVRLDLQQQQRFRDEGFLVLRAVLDPVRELAPLMRAYSELIDGLAPYFLRRTSLADGFAARPFSERIAILTGVSGGRVFDHLAPQLRAPWPGFRYRPELPGAQLPELFELMRNAALLDLAEPLIGSEIAVTSAHHNNLKLSHAELQLASQLARERKLGGIEDWPLLPFYVGATPWHTDVDNSIPGSSPQILVVWIPLSEASQRTSRLLVKPGSHRGANADAGASDYNQVALDARPGDVVLFDARLHHASTDNPAADEMRWSFNFRYLPAGQSDGRPHLPGFVARSRAHPERELRDPALWMAMWRAALEHVRFYDYPAGQLKRLSPRRVQAIQRRFPGPDADHTQWLRLPRRRPLDTVRFAPRALLERAVFRLRGFA